MKWESGTEFDRALGVDTGLTDRDWSRRRQSPCQPTPLEALSAVAARLTTEDHIADLGCGVGRAVFYFAHEVGCTVTGVELDERRYSTAKDNHLRLARHYPKSAAQIQLVHMAAQDWRPDGVTAFYCFNPFPAAVLRGVLKQIAKACGRVRMFCYYPDDEWCCLLSDSGWHLSETIDLRGQLGNDPRERVEIWIWNKEAMT